MCLTTNFKHTGNKIRIHKIRKKKTEKRKLAVTGIIEFIWVENGKKFKHRNLKK